MQNDKNYLSLEDPKLPEQLNDARRNNAGMTVPADFFAQFERKMNAVIDAAEEARKVQPEPVQLRPKTSARRWLSVAALALAVIAASVFLFFGAAEGTVTEADPSALSLASADAAAADATVVEAAAELVADEMTVTASDYDIFDLYCDL